MLFYLNQPLTLVTRSIYIPPSLLKCWPSEAPPIWKTPSVYYHQVTPIQSARSCTFKPSIAACHMEPYQPHANPLYLNVPGQLPPRIASCHNIMYLFPDWIIPPVPTLFSFAYYFPIHQSVPIWLLLISQIIPFLDQPKIWLFYTWSHNSDRCIILWF